jgi:hypothetical protein
VINEESQNITIDGYEGTWTVAEKIEHHGQMGFLLDHDWYPDGVKIIVTADLQIIDVAIFDGLHYTF